MTARGDGMDGPVSFDTFWTWLLQHHNCILRAGTEDAVLYDDDDLHWHFAQEDGSTWVVQLYRGKQIAAELFVDPERVSYVQVVPGEEEVSFELVQEDEQGAYVAYLFVLSHGFDSEDRPERPRVH